MKKRLISLLLIVLLSCSLIAFAGCSTSDKIAEMQKKLSEMSTLLQQNTTQLEELQEVVNNLAHVHTWGDWQYDELEHWREYDCGHNALANKAKHVDADEDGFCDECGYALSALTKGELTEEMAQIFKDAYFEPIAQVPTVDYNGIEIINYFGTIREVHLVSYRTPYYDTYPNGAYIDIVENMEFRYDRTQKVYLIYNEKLYTAKEAYEMNIINFNELCKVFGIHTSGLATFNADIYYKLDRQMKALYEVESYLYLLTKYYGEYGDYTAVSYHYRGGQAAATAQDCVNNLLFSYGYSSDYIRFMNEEKTYSIQTALTNNIITKENLYDIFEIHTASDNVDENLVRQLLTPAYEMSLKYKEYFYETFTFDSFYLSKYYGKYGDNYVFALSAPWIKSNAPIPEEDMDMMAHGFADIAYVLRDGKIYSLYSGILLGIFDKSYEVEILAKYYGYY